MEVEILKALTWYYVIDNPALTTIQHGHRRVVRTLFRIFLSDARGPRRLLPASIGETLEAALEGATFEATTRACTRAAADAVAVLTDEEALRLYRRFLGVEPGSLLAPVM